MACGNLIDLITLLAVYLALLAQNPIFTGDGEVMAYGAGAAAAIPRLALGALLLQGVELEWWLRNFLPVRGLHARRLLAAMALLGVFGPLIGMIWIWRSQQGGSGTQGSLWLGILALLCGHPT
jgi:hypothetical protein